MMDIVKSCQFNIQKQLDELDQLIDEQKCKSQQQNKCKGSASQTQGFIEVCVPDKDKNLDRILDQQAHLKTLIERDGRIISLNKQISEDIKTIDLLRKSCAQIERNALKTRQDLLETQANELERFQMGQLKSIADDYRRHQEILESRKKEIARVKSETENEDSKREAYLLQYEKDLDKQLQARKQMRNDR